MSLILVVVFLLFGLGGYGAAYGYGPIVYVPAGLILIVMLLFFLFGGPR